jgi:hypothetical protein
MEDEKERRGEKNLAIEQVSDSTISRTIVSASAPTAVNSGFREKFDDPGPPLQEMG